MSAYPKTIQGLVDQFERTEAKLLESLRLYHGALVRLVRRSGGVVVFEDPEMDLKDESQELTFFTDHLGRPGVRETTNEHPVVNLVGSRVCVGSIPELLQSLKKEGMLVKTGAVRVILSVDQYAEVSVDHLVRVWGSGEGFVYKNEQGVLLFELEEKP